MTTTITIGRKFWDDHISRDLPVPTVVTSSTTRVVIVVEPDSDGWIELASDANFYSDFTQDEDPFLRALGKAALRLDNAMYVAAERYRSTHRV